MTDRSLKNHDYVLLQVWAGTSIKTDHLMALPVTSLEQLEQILQFINNIAGILHNALMINWHGAMC